MGKFFKHKYTLHGTVLLLVVAVVGVFTFGILQKEPTSAQTAPAPCTTPYSILPTAGPAVVFTGTTIVSLSSSTTPVSPIQGVQFMITSTTNTANVQTLGRGVVGTSSNFWSMSWVTPVTPNGTYFIGALVKDTAGVICRVQSTTSIAINNPTATQINAQPLAPINPTIPTNTNIDFSIPQPIPALPTSDITQWATFDWSTTIGSVTPSPSGNIARLASGPAAGTGQVKVLIKYGGITITQTTNVQVVSPPTSTTTPTTNTTTTTSTGTPTTSGGSTTQTPTLTTTNSPTTSSPPQPTLTTQLLSADTSVKQCLQNNIGAERLTALETEKVRPTPQEFDSYRKCFAKTSFVVASTLAPVAPTDVKNLKDVKNIEISNAFNEQSKVNGDSTTKLVFKGKGDPNKTVLLYVFSEPLVLATTTNDSGEWSYTLEDPLAPGNHEAYALVSKGDNTYQRSTPFGFLIGKAEASASNPQGYSLALQIQPTATTNNRTTNMFIAAIIFVVVFSVSLLSLFVGIRMHAKKTTTQSSIFGNDNTPPSGAM